MANRTPSSGPVIRGVTLNSDMNAVDPVHGDPVNMGVPEGLATFLITSPAFTRNSTDTVTIEQAPTSSGPWSAIAHGSQALPNDTSAWFQLLTLTHSLQWVRASVTGSAAEDVVSVIVIAGRLTIQPIQ